MKLKGPEFTGIPNPKNLGWEFTVWFQKFLAWEQEQTLDFIPTPKRMNSASGWDFDYYSEESSDGDMIEDGM